MLWMHILFFLFVGLFTAAAALWDARTQRLPNVLTVSALVLGILFQIAVGAMAAGWTGAAQGGLRSLGGFATGFGILLVLWLMGGGGGGDVKLMGALGAWLGPVLTVVVFLVSVVFVCIGAAGMLTYECIQSGIGRTRQRYLTPAATPHPRQKVRRRLLPFGVPVAMATWCVLIVVEWV